MQKRTKVFSVAAVIITLLFSQSYIAFAYWARYSMRNQPVFAETELPPAPDPAVPDEDYRPVNPDLDEVVQEKEPVPPTGYVYLTIDDGPDPVTTPLILEILDYYKIKATFFVIGTQIERYPELVTEMDKRGHYVGNHTYSHKYSEIYVSREAFVRSLQKNEELLFKTIGKRPEIVRDPGGGLRSRPEMSQYTTKQGYRIMGWNIDSFDSRVPVPDSITITNNVHRQSQQKNLWQNMIILVHEGRTHMSTVQALPNMISSLLDRGFVFVIPTEE